MGVQFDWQAGTDQGEWETVASSGPRRLLGRLRRLPPRAWRIAAAVILILAVAGAGLVKLHYDQVRRRVAAEIQDLIDLEALTYERGETVRFLALQDRSVPGWFGRQARRVSQNCRAAAAEGSTPAGLVAAESETCWPVLPARVERVELRRDVAWVEVIEGDPAVRRVRFYRQTDRGWLHTASRDELWRSPIEVRYGSVVVRYHTPDRRIVAPFLERIEQAALDIDQALGYAAPTGRLTIDLQINDPTITRFSTVSDSGARLDLLSPWLSGIPVDGQWSPEALDDLTYTVTLELATLAARSVADRSPNLLQRAVAAEYTAWSLSGDLGEAPLLGPVIAARGVESLPRLFLSVRGTSLTTMFLIQWRSLHPVVEQGIFFETLLNIEREAARVGRLETFLLLQDGADEGWLRDQLQAYEQARFAPAPLRVSDVQIDEAAALARVTLGQGDGSEPGAPPDAAAAVVYYRKEGEDWKHTPPPLTSDDGETVPAARDDVHVAQAPASTMAAAITPRPIGVVAGSREGKWIAVEAGPEPVSLSLDGRLILYSLAP